MNNALKRLLDWLWLPCPRGQHRLRGSLITIKSGQQFCWHPDCRDAVLEATYYCNHRWWPFDEAAGYFYERCHGCRAHRLKYGVLDDFA